MNIERATFKNPLPGVPDVESPFFEELFAVRKLSAEEMCVATDMRDKGYAIIDFPDGGLEEKAERIKRALYPKYEWMSGKPKVGQ